MRTSAGTKKPGKKSAELDRLINSEDIEDLKLAKSKLFIIALRQFANSPIQLKTRELIKSVTDKIESHGKNK